MTPPEQAIAARLTAAAQQLRQTADYWQDKVSLMPTLYAQQVALVSLLNEASAHVETLTQQVAELTEDIRTVHYEIARMTDKHADIFDNFGEPFRNWAQTLREMADGWPRETALTLRQRAEQAEQQRDAAHAALKKYGQLVNELKAARLDPGHESLIAIDRDKALARVLAADVALLKGIGH